MVGSGAFNLLLDAVSANFASQGCTSAEGVLCMLEESNSLLLLNELVAFINNEKCILHYWNVFFEFEEFIKSIDEDDAIFGIILVDPG